MSLAAVLLVIYGLKRITEHGMGWAPVAATLAGIGIGAVFVRRQQRLADPFIDVRLFRSPAFSVALAAYTLGTFVAFGMYIYIAQYLQLVLELPPLQAGVWMLPYMLAFVVGSLVVPAISQRIRPAYFMSAGLVLAAVGFLIYTQMDQGPALPLLVIGSVIYSFGISPVIILATDLIVGSAPVERAGAASAISETSSELGGALGIAVLGSIGAAVYRGAMAGALPAAVPGVAAEAARSTLGGAMAEAGKLPGGVGAELVNTARAAFMQSMELSAAVCAVIAVGTAILVAVLLRGVRSGHPAMEPEPA
jgi:DHA2 family multidrug resistance protein-like MFS transporter